MPYNDIEAKVKNVVMYMDLEHPVITDLTKVASGLVVGYGMNRLVAKSLGTKMPRYCKCLDFSTRPTGIIVAGAIHFGWRQAIRAARA